MLEVKIEELTKAVIMLTELIGKIEAKGVDSVPVNPAPVAAPIQETVIAYTEADQAVAKQIVEAIDKTVMPAAPTFEPVATAPVSNCPITDGKSLIDYVMTAYKEMGAEKGAGIQNVLVEMGLTNVNEVRPTEYATFFAKVEALK